MNFKRDKETGFTDEKREMSHTVIVDDAEQIEYVRRNLRQYDKVFVEGYLNYQQCVTEDGEPRMSGAIFAVQIEKTE